MDIQIFNYASVSSFKQRPSEPIRYLINRQLPKLIDIAIAETLEFNHNAQTKMKALRQLKYTVLIAEERICKYLEKIIKSVVRIWQLEIEGVEKMVKDIMVIVGFHVRSNYYLPLMINLLGEEEFRNSNKNLGILLKLISFMLMTSQDIEIHLQQITKLISTYEVIFLENDDGLSTIAQISMTLTQRLTKIQDEKLVSTIFSVLLNIEATKSIQGQLQERVKKVMEVLAKKGGYKCVAELHSHQVGPVINRIMEKKQYVGWNKSSKNRFKFDTIVRNCQDEVVRFINQILTVLQYCISSQCDIEIRMDTLVLLQQMLSNQHVRTALKQYSTRIYLKLLNPAIKWKVGKPQIKIRKAGIINMMRMIEYQVISESQLLQCFSEILPQIKSCITDDWAPELRLSCCQFLEKMLNACRENIDGEQLKDLYVVLLQRLDDSQDAIRKKVTTAINLFFMCRYLPLTASVSSIMQYMISAIFVHYDDSNEEIRDAINGSLRFAAVVSPDQVLKNARISISKMKHKEQCGELIQYCNQIIEEKKI